MNRNKKTKTVKSNKAISYIELNNNLQTYDSMNNNTEFSKKEND